MSNRFSVEDMDFLENIVDYEVADVTSMSNRRWQAHMKKHVADLYEPFGKCAREILRDHELRAKFIVSKLLEMNREKRSHEEKVTTIVLLDGCGRMVQQILRALRKEGEYLNSQNFVIYEVDERNHCFHKRLQGRQVTCLHDSIINVYRMFDPSKTFLYLNFCGIGRQLAEITRFLEEARKPVLLSFSKSARSDEGVALAAILESEELVSSRRDFVTFWVKRG